MSDNHARTDLGITHHRVLIATKPLSLIRKLNLNRSARRNPQHTTCVEARGQNQKRLPLA
jgi:hypothetical protein